MLEAVEDAQLESRVQSKQDALKLVEDAFGPPASAPRNPVS